jgi:uncharacterized coiled-coil protein SlyX
LAGQITYINAEIAALYSTLHTAAAKQVETLETLDSALAQVMQLQERMRSLETTLPKGSSAILVELPEFIQRRNISP